ncbi:Nardilysin [Trachymyrmex cornetzi]|uniref:Nardilysin n=1 Tax=Trachymyrmex cornetzi TaxID=471704 RepID=A0A195DS01_9HYME|nr:Nardilysin [Trachymyrmex cornetzi]
MEHTEENDQHRVEYLEKPVKSESDKKDYRVIRLVNGLTALLISDINLKTDDFRNEDDERNEKKVEVTWTVPLPSDFYNSKPHEYLAWIIRHGGKGSLTSYLRNKMPNCISLDDNVQCSSETFLKYNGIYTMFKITVKLFCEEQEHLKEVLDAIFSFINLLKKDDPHKRPIYYDIYKIMKYNFSDVKLSILKLIHYTHVDMHTALSSVNFNEFRRFVKSFTAHLYVQCLVQGNITPDDAIETVQECLEIMNCGPLLSNTLQQMIVMQIPLGISRCKIENFNKANRTSVVTNYYQIGIASFKLSVLLDLMMKIMDEMIRDDDWLVDQQLQFEIVSCRSDYINGVLGYFITVSNDANKCTTEHMDQQIETFLQLFNRILEGFQETNLNYFKKRLIAKKLNQYFDNTLSEEVDRNWIEIITGKFVFDRYEREMLVVKDIEINDLKECFAEHTMNGIEDPKTEHFTLEYIDDDQQEIEDHSIVDVEDYKKNLYMYPLKAKNN